MESMKSALAEYIESQLEHMLRAEVNEFIRSLDISSYIKSAVNQYFLEYGVDSGAVEQNFEQRIAQSVSEKLIASNIQWNNYKLTGNLISGGCIENFSSTGVVDQANDIELVVKDEQVIVENTAVVRELSVIEDAVIEGNLVVKGSIGGDNDFARTIQKTVHNDVVEYIDNKIDNLQLAENSELKFGNTVVLSRKALGSSITDSNLRSFGIVKELEVSGEASIADTLMVTATGRVGINTMEPDSSLTIWDEEVKISFKKLSKKQGYIGVTTNQKLVLGVDDTPSMTIDSDKILFHNDIMVQGHQINFSNSLPGHKAVTGSICFNARPSVGDYAGWINVGDTRWAGFGKIA